VPSYDGLDAIGSTMFSKARRPTDWLSLTLGVALGDGRQMRWKSNRR
jgi:hypothetical protein